MLLMLFWCLHCLHIPHLFPIFLSLTLDKYMFDGIRFSIHHKALFLKLKAIISNTILSYQTFEYHNLFNIV